MHCHCQIIQKIMENELGNESAKRLVTSDEEEQFKTDQKRRNEELYKFLDEFVNSEEYKAYLKKKKQIKKKDVYVQYSLKDTEDVPEPVIEDKYPLTTQSKKMRIFMKKFDNYVKNKKNKEILKNQDRGIKIIKEKIAEYKLLYECTRDKIREQKDKAANKTLEEVCKSLNIDLSPLSLTSKNRIRDKVVCYQKIKRSQQIKTRTNVMDIIEKLAEEYSSARRMDKRLSRTYEVRKNERIIKDMEVVGEKINLRPITRESVKMEPEIVEELLPAPEEERVEMKEKEKTKGKKEKVSEKENKKGQDKKSKKTQDKEGKKSGDTGSKKSKKTEKLSTKKSKTSKATKTDKKKKESEDDLIVPPIPRCNLRYKIGPENYVKLLELLRHFENLEDMMEDQHMLQQKLVEQENLYDDRNFCWKPNVVLFNNFKTGKSYKKKLQITNTSTEIQKLRILKMVFRDPYDCLLFKIEPLFGVQKLAMGCVLDLIVTYSPDVDDKSVEGKIVFATYNRKSTTYKTFFVEIQCIPPYCNLTIHPTTINFGKMLIWRANDTNCKILKIKNNGSKPCTVVIRKVPDPLELDVPPKNPKPNQNKKLNPAKTISVLAIQECLENIFNYFHFEHYNIKIQDDEEVKLQIKFKNVEHIGSYFEKYVVDVYAVTYEGKTKNVGYHEICLLAETYNHFIELPTNVLDFGVCYMNSIYQLSFDIHNTSSVTQTVCLKFPSSMTEYVKCDGYNLYIPPVGKSTVWLKFLPRQSVCNVGTYYDTATSILEFPMQICLLSKTYLDIPPIKTTVFAVLSTQKSLRINPLTIEVDENPTQISLDLGECSILETITADIDLVNQTLAPQIYGFTNVPQCLLISPNFGFGEIMPGETKTLNFSFSPNLADVIDNFTIEGSALEAVTSFRLNLGTISFLGQSKKQYDYNRLKKPFQMMLKELRSHQNEELIHDIEICAYYIKLDTLSVSGSEEGSLNETPSAVMLTEEVKDKAQIDNFPAQIWLRAKISVPLIEFSHQYVEFPDTPCGSYSIMKIDLTSANTNKRKHQIDYIARFKILGGSDEITVEPTCGVLRKGETRKITLIAKPNAPEELVMNAAKNLKYSEVYASKKQEYELRKKMGPEFTKPRKEKNVKGKKGGDKKGKVKKNKSENIDKNEKSKDSGRTDDNTENVEPEIVVSERELTVNYLDLYPAEMFYWRSLQPYTIKAAFTCTIKYEGENITKQPTDTLHLNATCKVIKPEFITNLKMQRIEFVDTVLGMETKEPIIIQNIHYNYIKPKFTLLNPTGPFSIPRLKNMRIPPEHFLEIPVTFKPAEIGKIEEYFEISSGKTMLTLVLQGAGVVPNITISPDFSVFRLVTKKQELATYPIEIRNLTGAEITIVMEKLFELEGRIRGSETITNKQASKVAIGKRQESTTGKPNKKAKGGKKDGSNASNKKSAQNYNELTEEEQYSLANFFTAKSGNFCYDVISTLEKRIDIKQGSATVINIGFSTPEILLAKKLEMQKLMENPQEKSTKGTKKGKDKSTAVSKKTKKGKEKGSKKSESKGGVFEKLSKDQVYYVAKYNIMLNNTFLKDVILIGAFNDNK